MEATALSIGKSVLNGALSYAKSALAEEVALQLGVRRDQLFITNELEMMQAFLMAAHDERDDNEVVKVWVKQVRDVAYDVEDTLQEFAVRLEKQSWWRIRRTLLNRRRVAKQMKELRANVEDVSQRNMRYNLIKGSGPKPTTAAEQSSITSAALFGIDGARRAAKQDKSKVNLIQLINEEENDLRVIAVSGTRADLGQSSIIREVYENPDIERKFSCRAWVRLMHPFNPQDFIQSIVEQFHTGVGAKVLLGTEKTVQELAVKFFFPFANQLAVKFDGYMNKRYLIVINDLSTIEEWDRVKKCFPNNKMGSRIIVSTAQVEVAGLCAGRESMVSELKQLSADQYIYAFHEKGSQDGTNLTQTGSSSNEATTTISNNSMVSITEIRGDQSEGSQDGTNLNQTRSSSNGATTIISNNSMVPIAEIREDQSEGSQDGTGLTKTGSRSNRTTNSTYNDSTVHISEDQSKGGDGKKAVGKSLTCMRTMAAALEESHVIGRVEEKSDIIKLFSNQATQQYQVISVWGMGGIGKTTLVKEIYQNQELNGTFEKRACVTIMRPFTLKELLKSLVMQLHADNSEKKDVVGLLGSLKKGLPMMSQAQLSTELAGLLESKKCLIVLDDVSSTAEWNEIISILPKMENTSRIVVTTREESIAKHCSEQGNVYKLQGLGHDEARDLFTRKVFKKTTDLNEQYPELVEPAELILRKCDRLPLAIVVIGGFLANQPKTALEWRKFNEHINAELEMNPDLGIIRTVLIRSYNGLPYHLKSCFLYMSIFPEDHRVRRGRLVRRWSAEGYPKRVRGKSAEEISDSYFMELISRSMIMPSQQSIHSTKGTDSCQVHDLMHDISISKSTEENLVSRLEEGCSLNTLGTARHIAINSNWEGDQSEFESIVDMSRVRSITVFGEWKSFFISDKMSLLRVLDLEDTTGLLDHHLERIGKLLHLRYISLRGCDDIYHLPDSLGNLRQLETLDIRGTSIVMLPKTIIKLRKLNNLRAAGKPVDEDVSYEDQFVLDDLPRVINNRLCMWPFFTVMSCFAWCAPQVAPTSSSNALNRRDVCTRFFCYVLPAAAMRLDLYGVLVPRGMRKLKALHTLGVVNIARGKGVVLKDIKRLIRLHKLGVTGVNEENGEELCSAIAGLSRLESLSIRSEGKPGLSGCLDGLTSPPENLQSLKLYGNLVELPKWIQRLENIVKLKLRSTMLLDADTVLEVLGNLPNLASLHLLKKSFQQGEEFCLNFHPDPKMFPSLVMLELAALDSSCRVKFEGGATPKLELLKFDYADIDSGSVSGIPSLSGLKQVVLQGDYDPSELEYLRAELDKNPNQPIVKMI